MGYLKQSEYLKFVMDSYCTNMNRVVKANSEAKASLEDLLKKEEEVISSFEEFANEIEKIQNRPKFGEINIESVKLPDLNMDELALNSKNSKKFVRDNSGIELSSEGFLVNIPKSKKIPVDFSSGLGKSIIGTELAMSSEKITLAFEGVFKRKKEKEIDALFDEVKSIEKKIDAIMPELTLIKKSSHKYKKSFEEMEVIYNKEFSYVKEATKKTNDYSDFGEREKTALKNTVMLVGILYQMCKVQLLKKEKNKKSGIQYNDKVVTSKKQEADVVKKNVVESVKQDYQEIFDSMNLKDDQNGLINISEECADLISINRNFAEYDKYVVFLDEEKKNFIKVDKETGNCKKIELSANIEDIEYYDYLGIKDDLYILGVGDKERILIKYNCKSGKESIVDKFDSNDDSFSHNGSNFFQCNDKYMIAKLETEDCKSFILIYDYINKKEIEKVYDKRITEVLLNHNQLYYLSYDDLKEYDIETKEKKVLKSNFGGYNTSLTVMNNSIIALDDYTSSSEKKDFEVKIYSLDENKYKKQIIKEDCNLCGFCYDGYIYYIKLNKRKDSFCRYKIGTKEKEVLVEKTDIVRNYGINDTLPWDFSMQVVGKWLYYKKYKNPVEFVKIKVALEDDFYYEELCE